MKLIEIWKRLGKQPLSVTRNKEAVAFVNGEEYIISKIKYEDGKIIGFEMKPRIKWFSEMIKPEENRWVVVRDEDGKEYPDHQYVDNAWIAYNRSHGDLCGGMTTRVDVISWRYQQDNDTTIKEENKKFDICRDNVMCCDDDCKKCANRIYNAYKKVVKR